MMNGAFAGLQPPARCPKCGGEFGFLYSKPEFKQGARRLDDKKPAPEWLEWSCGHCGYTVRTPTADAATTADTAPTPEVDAGELG